MAGDGILVNLFGPLTGTGRGIGLLFFLVGLSIATLAVVGYLSPHIRNVEVELPDFR